MRRQKQAPTGHVIMQRNPVMRGWAQSHQHGSSKQTFAKVDPPIYTMLWQWARRRHPHQSRWWIRDKYFRSEQGNNWVCFGHVTRTDGARADGRLFRASSVPMRRHTKIKGEANPSDPQWESYFAARLGVRMVQNRQGRRHLLRLWKEPEGRGAVCHQPITHLTGWHRHHIVWRTYGGSDRPENKVLLHPNGHAQVHSHGRTVVQPRPHEGVGKA